VDHRPAGALHGTESKVYAAQIAELYPDGATVALFYVNSEFGQVYADAFKELADEYGIRSSTSRPSRPPTPRRPPRRSPASPTRRPT
jgi:hypothetical protein